MFLMLITLGAIIMTGQAGPYQEVVVREGPAANKIVMVNVVGMIHGEQADSVYGQLKRASKDKDVKGIILRVNSPGGTISGSDRIYKEILRFRRDKGVPVVGFMQSVAASGGYYTSVACEKIVAEPTAITGSIGVIMGHFVFQELLEDKLGIQPVFLTEGEKKDWPSSFHAPEQEELDYLRERLLKPAYERFVEVIEEGRKDILSPSEVREVADGSIYVAPQALDAKLIDEVGYLDDAIGTVKSLAGLAEAQVVEYRRPFSWAGFLTAQSNSVFKLDRMKLYELSTPQMLYLWSVHAQ
jgi:protease-4